MNKKRGAIVTLLMLMSLACGLFVLRLGAANPTSGTVTTVSAPVSWDGSAAAGASATGEMTCVEQPGINVNCDTFTLTVLGTPADWAGKQINVTISWVVLASDYDLYVHKGSNAGPEIGKSTAGAPGTNETVVIEATDLDAGGSTVFTAHVVYSAAAAGDQYHGVASVATVAGGPTPTPVPLTKSKNWTINYHGECCEGNLAAAGENTYLLLPVLVQGNKIKKSSDGGKTWRQTYPPAPASFPFGIEGDMQAFGDDAIFFGTELADAVVAHSDDKGETWTTIQDPIASAGNDQAWAYLGPFGNMRPGGSLPLDEPYVMAGWMRIGTSLNFSFDGGRTFSFQSVLVGNDGSGPEHIVCQQNAVDPPTPDPGDTRIANPLFVNWKAGRYGAFGTEGKFYWAETAGDTLYTCQTSDFGVNWTGNKHPLSPGPGSDFVVSHSAFDNNGTFYVLHGNKLYVSFNQGKTFAFTHTLPRYGSARKSDPGSDQYFVVNCGTIHIGLQEDAGNGNERIFYLRGTRVDTANPIWDTELVDEVGDVRLDFLYIVLDGNNNPTISYTTPGTGKQVTTASRNEPMPLRAVSPCDKLPLSVVSRKVHGGAGPFPIDLLNGSPAIECRSGGLSGNHDIVFTFPPAYSVGTAHVTSGVGEVSNMSVNGSEITVSLTGVENAQTIVLTLSGVNDGTTTGSLSVPVGFLLGDVDATRVVTTSDVNRTKAQALQPVTLTNFRSDIDAGGDITTTDVNLIKSKALSKLP